MSVYNYPTNQFTHSTLIQATGGNPGKNNTPEVIQGQMVEVDEVVYNHLLYTDDFSNAVWTKTVTGYADATDSDNELVQTFRSLTAASPGQKIEQTITISPAVSTLNFSVWIKSATPISVTITSTIGVGVVSQTFTTTSWWTYYTLTHTPGGTFSSAVIKITLNATGTIHVYGPQVVGRTDNMRMYIPSTSIKGSYNYMIQFTRFYMTENVDDASATAMMETPDATTAYMMEDG
jgi:hypothetical protein